MEGSGDRLKVAVRVRPPLPRELGKEEVVYLEGNDIQSSYDKIFNPNVQQAEVYEFLSPIVHSVIKGFNASVFAYGQTGSGKTYTMFGSDWEQNINSKKRGPHSLDNPTSHGVIPRAVQHLFQDLAVDLDRGHSFTVLCSFVQIYNERVFDLLQDDAQTRPLAIREDALFGIFVEGLAEYVVQTPLDCMMLIKRGDRNRAIRATKMNAMSSRSHSIFQIKLEGEKANKKGLLKRAKLNLCDLAGSEKFDKEGEMTKPHIAEMGSINTSLTTLGKVISLLSTPGSTHIPYRDSKLTRLLQDSLGGNTTTCFLATISPVVDSIDETISTLKFADRAKKVLVRVKKNAISATNDRLIIKLQREIQHLKDILQLRKQGSSGVAEIQQRLWSLTMENQKLREINQGLSSSEVERLIEENKNMKMEMQRLYDQLTQAGSMPADTPRRSFGEGELTSLASSQVCFQCKQQTPCGCSASTVRDSGTPSVATLNQGSVVEDYGDARSHKSFDQVIHASPSRSSAQNSTSRTEYGAVRASSITTRQVEVRIRGRNNAIVTTTAPLEKSLEEQVSMQQRKRELRRAQQRLKTLEKIEIYREQKTIAQIQKLQEDRDREEAMFAEREQAQERNRIKLEEQRRHLRQYAEIKKQRNEMIALKAKETEEVEKLKWRKRGSPQPRAVSLRPKLDKIEQLLQS